MRRLWFAARSEGGRAIFWACVWAVLVAPAARAQGEPAAIDASEPLYAENGAIKQHPVFNVFFDSYRDVTLQEADRMSGNSFYLNVTVPLNRNTQLRFELPYRTEGDAILTQAGDVPGEVVGARTHIKGFNGLVHFYSLVLERRLRSTHRSSALWFAGFGYRIDRLDTTFGDKYNDLGMNVSGGMRYDRALSHDMHAFINYGLTFYAVSDDIGPSDRGWDWFPSADAWLRSELTAAAMLPRVSIIRPGIAARFVSDFLDYHTFALGPDFLIPWRNIDLKGGVLIGVNGEAEDYRARFGFVAKMF